MNKKSARILSAIMFQVASRPGFETIGLDQYRKLLERSAAVLKPDPDVDIRPAEVGGIHVEWHRPPEYDPGRVIFYLHGGGYIAGSVNSHRDLASRLSRAAAATLLVSDYALAPEHPFPAGLDDAFTLYDALVTGPAPPERICLAGDSAGGGLALALFQRLQDKDLPLPDGLVLFSPWTDLTCQGASIRENREKDFMINQPMLERTARLYTDQDLSSPLISPVNGTYETVPPCLIQVGANEALLDDSKRMARKLETGGGPVTLEVWDEMFHVWHYFAKYLPEGRQAIDRAGAFIRAHI